MNLMHTTTWPDSNLSVLCHERRDALRRQMPVRNWITIRECPITFYLLPTVQGLSIQYVMCNGARARLKKRSVVHLPRATHHCTNKHKLPPTTLTPTLTMNRGLSATPGGTPWSSVLEHGTSIDFLIHSSRIPSDPRLARARKTLCPRQRRDRSDMASYGTKRTGGTDSGICRGRTKRFSARWTWPGMRSPTLQPTRLTDASPGNSICSSPPNWTSTTSPRTTTSSNSYRCAPLPRSRTRTWPTWTSSVTPAGNITSSLPGPVMASTSLWRRRNGASCTR